MLSRVFYDHAVTLIERHQVLRNSINNLEIVESPVFWGLLATISLSKDGKKAIEGIGSVEQLSVDLSENDSASEDVYLFKLSLFSRLAALKHIQNQSNLALPQLFAKVKNWLS